VLACSGHRGEHSYSNGGYAVLGQLVADLTDQSYAQAATRLVLEPLAMTGSFFPAAWPAAEPDTVTGYVVADDGTLKSAPALVCTMPAAGGLWSTAGDLVRFGLSWVSLLPAELAREALTPQSTRPGGVQVGLGWHLTLASELAGHLLFWASCRPDRLGSSALSAESPNRSARASLAILAELGYCRPSGAGRQVPAGQG
jgi:CubicO group peptidase (beta-lactamase class C family)